MITNEEDAKRLIKNIPLHIVLAHMQSIFSPDELSEQYILPLKQKIEAKYSNCIIKSKVQNYKYRVWIEGNPAVFGESFTYRSALQILCERLSLI